MHKKGIIRFVSDKLIPFTRLTSYNLFIKNYNDCAYTNTNIWNISCNTFELWDDTPVGHACPDIIIPLLSQDDSNNNNINSLMIDVMLAKDYWKYPTQINIQTYDKRVIILKRYIEEIFQYFISKDDGIGKLLFAYFSGLVKVDGNNNHPPTLLWNCIIKMH